MERYLLQQSDKPGHWVCTDQENLIVCVFKEHQFNETQEMTTLENFDPNNFMKLATYMREMGDWLFENHYDKIF